MSKVFDLTGKVAVVTGGSKGIGEHIARALAGQGARVHILDIDEENGIKVSHSIEVDGFKATFHTCNLADESNTKTAFDAIFSRENRLDILVNNAGIAQIGNVENTSGSDMHRIFDINVMSIFHCIHASIGYMKQSGGGSIINMSSIAAQVGLGERFGYSMSKGAALSMTYSVAKDYVSDNIRCNAVAPGRVHTPFVDDYLKQNYPDQEQEMFDELSKTQPIGRMGKPGEIAHLVLYLCSDEASFITGSYCPIDGGFKTLNS